MLDALNITEEEAQGLAELAQHDLAMARDFARRAQAAEDSDEANRLARSYQRAARSYRQTLAMKVKLQRDLAQAAAASAQGRAAPQGRPGRAAVGRRVTELKTALLRLAWDEAERLDDEAAEVESREQVYAWHVRDVLRLIAQACSDDGFAEEPLDDQITDLADELAFHPDAIARWRDLPDPPAATFDVAPDEEEWRSSG